MTKHLARQRQQLGQVFLRDPLMVEQILQCAMLTAHDTVLEIGPGRGALTIPLAQRVPALYAIELDAYYARTLQQRFHTTTHVHILHADARTYDYSGLPHPLSVVANLPYSMGMAILTHLLTFRHALVRLTIMLQQEVATRLVAAPNTSAYGALSVFFQYYTALTRQFDVPREAFAPVPAVDSTVLTLVPWEVLPWPSADEPWLFRVVKSAFAHRRKTLRANLLAAFPALGTPAQVVELLTTLQLGLHVRAQELHVSQFVHLAALLRALVPQPTVDVTMHVGSGAYQDDPSGCSQQNAHFDPRTNK